MRLQRDRHGCTGILLGICLAILSGCGPSGPKLYGVSGTVKYKGDPIKLGMISFRAENGAAGAAEIKDGKYELPPVAGLQEGKYRVAITYPDPKVPAPRPDEPPGPAAQAREMLPPKYNDKTELTAEIKPQNSNEVNFDLK
jgi:hypothetical protein